MKISRLLFFIAVCTVTGCDGFDVQDPLGIQRDIDETKKTVDDALRQTDSMLRVKTKSDSLLEEMDSVYMRSHQRQ
jgi:hypothetical protein